MADDPTLTDPPQDPPQDPPADPPPDPDDLGDKGKKALAEERAARRAAEKAAKEAREEAERLRQVVANRQKLYEIVAKDETEQAIEEARQQAQAEARREALAIANQRLISAEVRAAAAKKGLADPADAVRLLDLDQFSVSDDGEVDASAIEAALDDLVESKSYLKSATPTGIDQGPRGGPPEPADPAKETDPKKVVEWARKLRSSA